jgi:hypothetical protein
VKIFNTEGPHKCPGLRLADCIYHDSITELCENRNDHEVSIVESEKNTDSLKLTALQKLAQWPSLIKCTGYVKGVLR